SHAFPVETSQTKRAWRWEMLRLTQAQNHACHDHRGKAPHQPGHDGSCSPDKPAHGQRAPGAKPVAYPPSRNLKAQIRPAERGKNPTQLKCVEVQFLLKDWARSVHVDAVNVGERVHQAHHPKHIVGRGKYSLALRLFLRTQTCRCRCRHVLRPHSFGCEATSVVAPTRYHPEKVSAAPEAVTDDALLIFLSYRFLRTWD